MRICWASMEKTVVEYLVITMDNCPYCDKAKALLAQRQIDYREVNIMDVPELGALPAKVGRQTLPLVLQVVGGFDELNELLTGKK